MLLASPGVLRYLRSLFHLGKRGDHNKPLKYEEELFINQVHLIKLIMINANKLFCLNRGSQESVTFYQTNGTHVDLSGIPKPLLTNVTAQSMIGVAPVGTKAGSWGNIDQLASFPNTASSDQSG